MSAQAPWFKTRNAKNIAFVVLPVGAAAWTRLPGGLLSEHTFVFRDAIKTGNIDNLCSCNLLSQYGALANSGRPRHVFRHYDGRGWQTTNQAAALYLSRDLLWADVYLSADKVGWGLPVLEAGRVHSPTQLNISDMCPSFSSLCCPRLSSIRSSSTFFNNALSMTFPSTSLTTFPWQKGQSYCWLSQVPSSARLNAVAIMSWSRGQRSLVLQFERHLSRIIPPCSSSGAPFQLTTAMSPSYRLTSSLGPHNLAFQTHRLFLPIFCVLLHLYRCGAWSWSAWLSLFFDRRRAGINEQYLLSKYVVARRLNKAPMKETVRCFRDLRPRVLIPKIN